MPVKSSLYREYVGPWHSGVFRPYPVAGVVAEGLPDDAWPTHKAESDSHFIRGQYPSTELNVRYAGNPIEDSCDRSSGHIHVLDLEGAGASCFAVQWKGLHSAVSNAGARGALSTSIPSTPYK